MKRYRIDFSYGRYFFDERPDGDWVRFKDHEEIIRRQAAAAISGMNAATEISTRQLKLARQVHAESSPEALESERAANARLTEEIEQLRDALLGISVSAQRISEEAMSALTRGDSQKS